MDSDFIVQLWMIHGILRNLEYSLTLRKKWIIFSEPYEKQFSIYNKLVGYWLASSRYIQDVTFVTGERKHSNSRIRENSQNTNCNAVKVSLYTAIAFDKIILILDI